MIRWVDTILCCVIGVGIGALMISVAPQVAAGDHWLSIAPVFSAICIAALGAYFIIHSVMSLWFFARGYLW